MNSTVEPPSMRVPQQKKGRGCFFYGCITSVVLVLVMVVVGIFVVRGVKNWILSYTDTSPMELPTVEVTDAEYEALQQRMSAFKEALEKGDGTESLILTEKDINALIARSPDTKELKDTIYVSIEDDQVKGQISFPLDKTGFGWLKGRYLNGAATFNVLLEDGALDVTVDTVEVNGKALPDQVMAELRKENLAREFANDPETAKAIANFQSIKVQGGEVIITAAEKHTAEPVAEPAP